MSQQKIKYYDPAIGLRYGLITTPMLSTPVINDLWLRRTANDFNSFSLKSPVSVNDRILIEDSEDGYTKKIILIQRILDEVSSSSDDGLNLEALTDNKTLTKDDVKFQHFTCSANYDVLLPTDADTGKVFHIYNANAYNSEYYLTIKQGVTAIDKIYAQGVKSYVFNGTNWRPGVPGSGGQDTPFNLQMGYNGKAINYGTAYGVGAEANNGSAFGYNAIAITGTALGKTANTNSKGRSVAFEGTTNDNFNEIRKAADTLNDHGEGWQTWHGYIDPEIPQVWHEIFIDGSSLQWLPKLHSGTVFNIKVIQYCDPGIIFSSAKAYEQAGSIRNDGTNSFIVAGIPAKISLGADVGTTTWDFQISADGTTGALKLEMKGDATYKIYFTASMWFAWAKLPTT